MALIYEEHDQEWQIARLSLPTFLLVVLAVMWGLAIAITEAEREAALERAQAQLESTALTLADLGALAGKNGQGVGADNPDRLAAFWSLVLQYPTAWFWLENNGVVSSGQAANDSIGPAIKVAAANGNVTAHAVLAKADALVDWRHSAWLRTGILLALSSILIGVTTLLSRALKQRRDAEQIAVVAEEKAIQFGRYKAELEKKLERRTTELQRANLSLNQDILKRRSVEESLHEHDELLGAVTNSAAVLLGSNSLSEAISAVFEFIGHIVYVSRIQLSAVTFDDREHLRSSLQYEWCMPGVASVLGDQRFQNMDLTEQWPQTTHLTAMGEISSLYIEEVAGVYKDVYEKAGMQSFLQIPIMIENKVWGILSFVDSRKEKREWTWLEKHSLRAFSRLIGNAIMRARYIQELANADAIVQKSPTILFRLKGDPSLQLVYISQNISQFGYDPAQLITSPVWYAELIDAEDRDMVKVALSHIMDRDIAKVPIEFRLVAKDGVRRWFEARCSPVLDKEGKLAEIEGIMVDITERKIAEGKIAILARTDALTALANRTTFTERLNQAFSANKRGGADFAVLYIDLDHFKDINDTLGHAIGDLLLQEVADRLHSVVRDTDMVARLGGDEFAVLQMGITDPSSAGALGEKILEVLAQPYELNGNALHVTSSIGIAPLGPDAAEAGTLLSQADLALYRAKEEGRNQYRFHTQDLDKDVRQRVALSDEVRAAIHRNEFELYYQPQVDLNSGDIIGMEALIRWNHPKRGVVNPRDFLSVAEKNGSMLQIGHWVINQACQQMRLWRDAGIAPPVISVNVSLAQLKGGQEFVHDIMDILEKWGLKPKDIELNVRESMLAQLEWAHNDALAQLRKIGVKIALDDFGTEYSSFDYVKTYQVSHLKIAQAFINQAAQDPTHATTVKAIMDIAHDFDIDVIAEGVDTEDQRALLLSIGKTTKGQGLYFSNAVKLNQATDMLRRKNIKPVSPGDGLKAVG